MRNGQKIDLGMTGYAELFMTDEERKTQTLPRIVDIPIEMIDDFPDHPFKVRMDEDMQQLVESIKERGLIHPVILRKKEDGRYEIVSGHRRKKACEIAGLTMIKAEVREMTRDEAIIMMVESNLQRSVILPSEKAYSYKMRLEALKRQAGRPPKENGGPVGHEFEGMKSRDVLAEETPDSARQIQRYIRLTELQPEILDLVDEGKIGLRPAVELPHCGSILQKTLRAVFGSQRINHGIELILELLCLQIVSESVPGREEAFPGRVHVRSQIPYVPCLAANLLALRIAVHLLCSAFRLPNSGVLQSQIKNGPKIISWIFLSSSKIALHGLIPLNFPSSLQTIQTCSSKG